MIALLALEDGRVFRGEAFGGTGTTTGEICFNTSMTGYQEILTDPSYRGQIVAMTYPEIGNYGVNLIDVESATPQVRGFVIEELSPVVSNWRADSDLDGYLKTHGIQGIQGIDTRALTRHLRTRGAMRACITTDTQVDEEAVRLALQASYEGVDFVKEVATETRMQWDPDSRLSRRWILKSGGEDSPGEADAKGNHFEDLPAPVHTLAAIDFGMKKNILRSLRRNGFQVTVVPPTSSAEDILALGTDGIFLSNGPGDPEALDYARATVSDLVGKKPIFGICLGHQILALALGARTFKLKFGHRGANQPVKDLRSGKVAITSQNHGYAVDPESLPEGVEVTHVNLNDGTCAGLRDDARRAFSVQYHPEASPGPHDADYFFSEFAKVVAASKAGVQ
jgi:carbamoyl-phosphate synthase small subunit